MKLRRLLLGCSLALATIGGTAVGEAHAATTCDPGVTECWVDGPNGWPVWMTTTRKIEINLQSALTSFSGIEIPGAPFPADGFGVSDYLNNPPPTPLTTFYTARLYQDGALVAVGKLEQAAAGGLAWNFTGRVVGPNTTVVWSADYVQMVLVRVTTG